QQQLLLAAVLVVVGEGRLARRQLVQGRAHPRRADRRAQLRRTPAVPRLLLCQVELRLVDVDVSHCGSPLELEAAPGLALGPEHRIGTYAGAWRELAQP